MLRSSDGPEEAGLGLQHICCDFVAAMERGQESKWPMDSFVTALATLLQPGGHFRKPYSTRAIHSVDGPIGHISTCKKDLVDLVVNNGSRQQVNIRARDPAAANRLTLILPTARPGQLGIPRKSDTVLNKLADLQKDDKIRIHSIRDYADSKADANGSGCAGAAGSGDS
jgi:hypothetical protein